jgi:hypothetical protein
MVATSWLFFAPILPWPVVYCGGRLVVPKKGTDLHLALPPHHLLLACYLHTII